MSRVTHAMSMPCVRVPSREDLSYAYVWQRTIFNICVCML